MKSLLLFFFLALAAAAPLGASTPHHPAHEAEWERLGKTEAEARVRLLVSLAPRDPSLLRAKFLSVSDPEHEDYKNYLSREEACALVRPSRATRALVGTFLKRHGLSVSDSNACGDAVYVHGSVAQVESAFSAELFTYRSLVRPEHVIVAAPGSLHVPKMLEHTHIAAISGAHFPAVKPLRPTTTSASVSSSYKIATPADMKKLYQLPDTPPSGGSQAAAGWERQSFSKGDLAHFQKHYDLPSNPIKKTYGHNTGFPHTEANLDVQIITSASLVNTSYFLNGGLLGGFDVLQFLYTIGNETSPELVWSISYGEDLDKVTVPYARACDAQMQVLATRGLSIMVASGDTGAKSRSSGSAFAAEFPAALPSCTAVGASVLNNDITETSCVDCSFGWCSGGGLTYPSYFRASDAPWSAAVVANYLQNASGIPAASVWEKEKGGVGFPDVAAVGSNHYMYYYALKTPVAGTSASSPQFSAIVGIGNAALLAAGKKPLGFLNPLLYKNPTIFNDITQGNTGWPAAVGWDATSGLGSVRWPTFEKLIMSSSV